VRPIVIPKNVVTLCREVAALLLAEQRLPELVRELAEHPFTDAAQLRGLLQRNSVPPELINQFLELYRVEKTKQ